MKETSFFRISFGGRPGTFPRITAGGTKTLGQNVKIFR